MITVRRCAAVVLGLALCWFATRAESGSGKPGGTPRPREPLLAQVQHLCLDACTKLTACSLTGATPMPALDCNTVCAPPEIGAASTQPPCADAQRTVDRYRSCLAESCAEIAACLEAVPACG